MAGSFRFETGTVTITPDEILADKGGIEAHQKQRAKEWLTNILAEGLPIASNEIPQGYQPGTGLS